MTPLVTSETKEEGKDCNNPIRVASGEKFEPMGLDLFIQDDVSSIEFTLSNFFLCGNNSEAYLSLVKRISEVLLNPRLFCDGLPRTHAARLISGIRIDFGNRNIFVKCFHIRGKSLEEMAAELKDAFLVSNSSKSQIPKVSFNPSP